MCVCVCVCVCVCARAKKINGKVDKAKHRQRNQLIFLFHSINNFIRNLFHHSV